MLVSLRLGFVLFDTGVQRRLRQLSSWILEHAQARTPASESLSIKHSTWTRSSSQAPVLVAFNNNDLPCTQATASFLVIRRSYFCTCINIKCIINFNHWNMFTIKPWCAGMSAATRISHQDMKGHCVNSCSKRSSCLLSSCFSFLVLNQEEVPCMLFDSALLQSNLHPKTQASHSCTIKIKSRRHVVSFLITCG